MTDDLVKRARAAFHDDRLSTGALYGELADRIEALTAERDKAYASGYSDAETEISKSALGQDNAFLHSQYVNTKLRIDALQADNARLRAALLEERTDTLWNAYNTGMERDGRWRHMCMSDGEWLERECGLDDSEPDHPADVVKAAIPLAAERFVTALNTGKADT
jgi:hypothetical protein